MRVAIVFSESLDESRYVPDEKILELAVVVWNHQQVYVLFPVAVFRGIEWKDSVVFVDENVDADDLI